MSDYNDARATTVALENIVRAVTGAIAQAREPVKVSYTIPQAAEAVGVSDKLLRGQIAHGLLEARRVGPGERRVIIERSALEEWVRTLPLA